MRAYSVALDRALALSATAHRNQERKGSSVPYIMHPVHTAMILLKHGFPEEVVIAGVLHDVVEDTAVTLAEIEAQFGPQVARLVDAVSERKREPGGELLPWRQRKSERIDHLRDADSLVAALKSADALHNVQAMLQDLTRNGEETWQRFRGSQADQLWYYTTLAAVLRQRLGTHPLSVELDEAVAQLAEWHRCPTGRAAGPAPRE
ncbi:MAG: HD domain-containing protein [Polyangia bacterium]